MDVIRLLTSNPAHLAKLDSGRLVAGAPAEITIVDLETEKTVDSSSFVSKGKNTPFDGKALKGWPVATVFGGKLFD